MVLLGCLETSINYRYSLRNNLEERSSDQYWFRKRSMFVVKPYKIHKFIACTKCTFRVLKQLVLTVTVRLGRRTMAGTLSQIILLYLLNTGMLGSKNSFERDWRDLAKWHCIHSQNGNSRCTGKFGAT
jgi:hypothetical protein